MFQFWKFVPTKPALYARPKFLDDNIIENDSKIKIRKVQLSTNYFNFVAFSTSCRSGVIS